jgi:hypothetical protein
MSFLLFNLIQNWDGEYSDKEPYQVIELLDKDHSIRGYSLCDEMGRTDFLPSANSNEESWFLPANEDTKLAFIGKKIYIKDKEMFVVKLDPSCFEDIEMLRQEKGYCIDDQKLSRKV